MSPPDDVPTEMTTAMDDTRAERLLSGRARSGDPAADAQLATFVGAVAGLAERTPRASPRLAALLAGGFIAGAPDAGTSVPVTVHSPRVRRRRLAALVTGSGLALVGFSGAASAGVLPGPVQDTVRSVVEATTPFTVPPAQKPAPDPRPTTTQPTRTTPAPPAPSRASTRQPSLRPVAPRPTPASPGRAATPEQRTRPSTEPGRPTARPTGRPTTKPPANRPPTPPGQVRKNEPKPATGTGRSSDAAAPGRDDPQPVNPAATAVPRSARGPAPHRSS